MSIKRFKYKISVFRKMMKLSEKNFEIAEKGIGLYIDPEFQVIDSKLEGYNYLFGRGRLAKSSLGLYTYVQYGANISNSNIGRFCSIGPNAIIAHGEHPTDYLSTHPLFFESSYIKDLTFITGQPNFNTHKQVNIGSDVWIGANCYIKDGVSIGNGAIIGAGAVVTKDIPHYSIAVGMPARVIKKRFDDSTIEKLSELEWWNWDIKKILDNKELFQIRLREEMLARIK